MSALFFTVTAAMLSFEGVLILSFILPGKKHVPLIVSFSYPLGVFVNGLLFFIFTALHLKLGPTTIWIGHIAVMAVLITGTYLHTQSDAAIPAPSPVSQKQKYPWLTGLFLVVAACTLIGAAVYVWLPLHVWDAYTNWNLRALQAFTDHQFLFHGVYKPQYPILLQSLQVLFATSSGWSDPVVNGATYLLSLTTFVSAFLLLRASYGSLVASIVCAAFATVPVAAIHLRQGYADIHVAAYVVLAALLLDLYARTKNWRYLLVSGLFVAAAAWTKIDGLYLGVIPWTVLSTWTMWKGKQLTNKKAWAIMISIITVSGLWMAFLSFRGLILSPHENTFALQWHPRNIKLISEEIFLQTSLGMHWWILIATFCVLIIDQRKKEALKTMILNPLFLWSSMTLLVVIFTYMFTGEGHQLPRHASLPRVMLTPTFLFSMSLVVLVANVIQVNTVRLTRFKARAGTQEQTPS